MVAGSLPDNAKDKIEDVIQTSKVLVDDAAKTRKLLAPIPGQDSKRDTIKEMVEALQDSLPPLDKALSMDELPSGTTQSGLRDIVGTPIGIMRALFLNIQEAKGTVTAQSKKRDAKCTVTAQSKKCEAKGTVTAQSKK